VPVRLLFMGLGGGIGTSLLAAVYPARDAAFSPPIVAITRGSYEMGKSAQTTWLVLFGFILFLLAGGVVWLPTPSPAPGYFACFFFILGMSFLVFPLLTLLQKPFSRISTFFGICPGLGTVLFFSHRGRNSVALAALATAVAMVVSIVIMVESFRSTVTVWLNQTLQADIIITMESRFKRGGTAKMSSNVIDAVRTLPHIVDIDPFRYINMEYQGHTAAIGVLDFVTIAKYDNLPAKKGRDPFLSARREGGIVISEGFATIHDKDVGDTLLLHTPEGDVRFTIHGIYYDYAVQYGIILFDWSTFLQYWNDRSLSSLGIYVKEGKVEEVRREINKILNNREGLSLFSNMDIKEKALDVFDQTFQITQALQIIAVFIAILGIVGSLASSVMERSREIGILRSEGLTRFQTTKLLIMESSLLGALGIGVGIIIGVILSVILIDVINYRSFGWTIQHTYPPGKIIGSVLIIFAFTLPAGIPPALKALSFNISGVLRHE
ncbi:MAG: FtsX-like permease family protein, partial [Thermodesulfobacteriota bacterium]|nr:FtsX-like permease family protein [Thermodesulfobacteriota bacterium]